MKRISYVEPSSLAKVFGGVVVCVYGIYVVLLDILLVWEMVRSGQYSLEFIYVWGSVLVFGAFCYVFGLVVGYVYNFISRKLGGINVEIE
jgi:hypothetical protein